MKILAIRHRIDWFWLGAAALVFAWWLASFHVGEVYLPGRHGRPSTHEYLAKNPSNYWLAMWVLGILAGFFLLRSVIYSPAFSEWHSRTAQRMEWERQNPRKRSLLWKFAMYVVLPLVLVFGLFALAIYLT